MNQTELIKVINGKDFEVPKGARLIDVCRDKGFDIPSFCYYADLALQASCRMCLVRIEDAEAANVLHDHVHRRHDRHHAK